jgi:hypothetical protein
VILDTCRANLDPWLGKPTRSRAEGSVSLAYRFDSATALKQVRDAIIEKLPGAP